jgi:hypothetical protein
LYLLDRETLTSTPVLDTYYGADFNSLNDIKATDDGILFFTDPPYGFEQGFRAGNPQLGSNVYRYSTTTKETTVLVTTLQRPNGVALLDDRQNGNGCMLIVSDSGFEADYQSPKGFVGSGDSAIYYMKDSSDGCFEPQTDEPLSLQPLQPVVYVVSLYVLHCCTRSTHSQLAALSFLSL